VTSRTSTSELCKKDLVEVEKAFELEKLAVEKSPGTHELTQHFQVRAVGTEGEKNK
jgi:hypothetical protein